VRGLLTNKAHVQNLLRQSPMLATDLKPHIGHDRAVLIDAV
jgi:fumarate hydratase class II